MPKIFYCNYCDYKTSKKSSYMNHLKSQKHNKSVNFKPLNPDTKNMEIAVEQKTVPMVSRTVPMVPKTVPSNITCKYCGRVYEYRKTLNRHLKNCKEKQIYDREQEFKLKEIQLKQELKVKRKKEKQLKEKLEELEEVQSDYYDLLKQIAKSKTSPQTINLHYVVNNFTEALNYEDLMNPKLTDEEVNEIKELEPLAGTINIIEKRCIIGMDVKKRPLHCLDTSRNKYLVRTKNEWKVDHYAKKIFKGAAKHMHDMYATNPSTSNLSLEQIMGNQQKLLKLESKTSKNKMIRDLNDKVYIKNIRIENIPKN